MKAHQILEAGLGHMKDRSATYDKPAGERSMGATVDAFRAITGHDLTEEQGWLFMGLLKMVRSQQGGFRADNYEDLAAYAGLQGEAAWAERANPDFGQHNTIDCRTDAEKAASPQYFTTEAALTYGQREAIKMILAGRTSGAGQA
jgi:ketol-acid reductoisomerase